MARKAAERANEILASLNFKLDHEDRKLRGDRWIWTHANAPEQPLHVNFRMSDAAASKVIKHAEAIVGLAQTETAHAIERARAKSAEKRREEAERRKQIEATKRIAGEKAAAAEQARRRVYAARQNRGQLTKDDQLAILASIRQTEIAPERIADELCIPLSRVRQAINETYELDAYMHPGKRVLCKIADVRAWVKSL